MPCHRSTQWGPDRITLGLRSDPIWSQRTSCPIGSARSWSTCVQCAYLVGCTLAQIGSPRMEWSPRCFHVLAMSLLHSLADFLIPHVRCASSLCFSLLPCSLLVCDLLCAGIISASLLSVSYIGTSSCYALFMSPPKAPSLSLWLGPSGFPLSSVLTREAIQACRSSAAHLPATSRAEPMLLLARVRRESLRVLATRATASHLA